MKNHKMIFLTGGARSGKSRFATELAARLGKTVIFVATCVPQDKEMKRRVALHRQSRPKNWKTIEEPLELSSTLKAISPKKTTVVIIDCLTLLLSNLMIAGTTERKILREMEKIVKEIKRYEFSTIIVSNEVGSGIVPENKLARDFRDIAGKINQFMARQSDEAYAMISGFPIKLKGS